jgi:hypothetical protein
MINFSITVDTDAFTKGMDELQEKQLPFARSKALNAVGVDVQLRERARLREVFTLRREAWADRSIKITHFATKTEAYTTVAIQPPGGEDRGDILGKFETDTEKTPFRSTHGIAVPIDVARNSRDIIPAAQRPSAFHLHQEGGRIVGDKGTYIVKLADGRELLLQRTNVSARGGKHAGRGTSARGTLLYIFVPRVKIKADLRFVPSAADVVERMWQQRFGEAFTAAMASAR